jgi:hypothetical protein
MKSFPLDKRLATNTDYYTESDTALIIQEIGTDDTAKNTAKVEGVPCAEIITAIGALLQNASNRLPLFNLGDLFIVVPPDKTYRFNGTASKYVRVKGTILRFAPGESLPASFVARYTEQGKKFYSYQAGALTSSASIAAGSATDLISFTCPTGEKWTFNNLLMAEATVASSKNYGFAIRLLLQDEPFDNLINSKTLLGLDQYACPYPPDDTDGANVGTLKDKPITVNPGQVLKVQAVNITSGALQIDDTTSKALIVGVKEYL